MLIIGMLLTLTAMALVPKVRVPMDVHGARLGWMSQGWLAEHRASFQP
jgi:hypothetical protein